MWIQWKTIFHKQNQLQIQIVTQKNILGIILNYFPISLTWRMSHVKSKSLSQNCHILKRNDCWSGGVRRKRSPIIQRIGNPYCHTMYSCVHIAGVYNLVYVFDTYTYRSIHCAHIKRFISLLYILYISSYLPCAFTPPNLFSVLPPFSLCVWPSFSFSMSLCDV